LGRKPKIKCTIDPLINYCEKSFFAIEKKTNPASVMAGMILPLLKKENDLTVQVQTTERNG